MLFNSRCRHIQVNVSLHGEALYDGNVTARDCVMKRSPPLAKRHINVATILNVFLHIRQVSIHRGVQEPANERYPSSSHGAKLLLHFL